MLLDVSVSQEDITNINIIAILNNFQGFLHLEEYWYMDHLGQESHCWLNLLLMKLKLTSSQCLHQMSLASMFNGHNTGDATIWLKYYYSWH
jgi:hypothetical protein